jgi:hypothetical protein
VPFATPVNEGLAWNVPPLRLYSSPVPVGLVTVTMAFPAPSEQSTDWVGEDGVAGCALIVKLDDETEVHPAWFVTVNEKVPDDIPVTV